MNMWIVAGVIALLVIVGGVAIVNAHLDTVEKETTTQDSFCGNSCTVGSNCGSPTCGAITGGSCGCTN